MSSTRMWVVVVIPETAKVTGQAIIANRNQIHSSNAQHATPRAVCMITVLRAVCGASEY
jgi:hypothetical protein